MGQKAKDPTQRAKGGFRCALTNAYKRAHANDEEVKRENALCKIVNSWSDQEVAELILSPAGRERGYLELWLTYAESQDVTDGLMPAAPPEEGNAQDQERVRREMVTKMAALVRYSKRSVAKTAERDKKKETLWGKWDRATPKGEVDRVMRLWDWIEAEWRKLPGNATKQTDYDLIAQLGLDFVYSSEAAVVA